MVELTKELLEHEYLTNYKTQKEIGKITGQSQDMVHKAMKKFGIPARPAGRIICRIGQKFGRLTVMEPVFKRDSNKTFKWRCLCECGNSCEVRLNGLVTGRTKSCGCLKEDNVGSKHQAWKGFGHIPRSFMSRYLQHSKRRGIIFCVTVEFLDKLFILQNGKCALTGLQLSFEHYGYKSKYATASLDRIDSSKGYIEGNVQWVHKKINFMKQSFLEDEFINLCQMVIEHAKKKKDFTMWGMFLFEHGL